MGALSTVGRVARRTFLVGSTAIAGGVAFGYYAYKKPLENPLKEQLADGEAAITQFIKIDADGVTLITPRADKGQGAYSIQTHLLAEELDVDPVTVRTDVGVPSAAYYNSAVLDEGAPGLGDFLGKILGAQMTGGSSTVPDLFVRMREAAAVARETLIAAAALKVSIPRDQLRTEDGHVLLPDGNKISYGELSSDAANIAPVTDVTLRDPKDWKFLGKNVRRTDIVSKSTGTQQYGIDMEFDGMLYATVLSNPGRGGAMKSYNARAAMEMRGIKKVVPVHEGIGVIGDNTWRVIQASLAVEIEFERASYPATSSEMWRQLELHINPVHQDVQRRNDGDASAAIDGADSIEVEYRLPHLAHAPLEPLNAVVLYNDDQIDIWTGTQIPRFIQNKISAQQGMNPDQIKVHVLPMGGSFGHRLEYTYVRQAVDLAKTVKGTHVKMTFSREQDFATEYPRPMTIAKGRGQVKDGKVESFDLDLVAPSLMTSWFGRIDSPLPGPDATITTGADDQPFAIPNYRVTGYRAAEMVPISSWRSVGASQNGFHHDCLLDELIHAAGADPLEERLRLCDDPIAKAVLEEAGRLAEWNGPQPSEGIGRGIAFVKSFGVPCAEIIEVEQTEQGIKINKVWCVADVGTVLDPVNIEAQMFGGVIYGLGHAMNCELTFSDYGTEQRNFNQYQGMRLYQTPEIVTKALENADQIRGIGEPGTPPAAPALANAIFAATGERVRELPLNKTVRFV